MNKNSESGKNKWEKFAQDQSQEQVSNAASSEGGSPHPEGELTQDTDLGIEFTNRQQLEEQLTAMEQKVDEYKEKNLRLLAQLKNIQERADRDVSNAHKFGTEKLIIDLLPIMDSLIRGLESSPDDASNQSVREGMKLTLELLEKTLKKHGVELISPTAGEKFNPEYQEAVSMQPDPNLGPNTVVRTIQAGYSLRGRILRAAMVIVTPG